MPDPLRKPTAPLLTVGQDRLVAAVLRKVSEANSPSALWILRKGMEELGMDFGTQEDMARAQLMVAAERMEGAAKQALATTQAATARKDVA